MSAALGWFIVRRAAVALALVLVVSTAFFVLIRQAPGNAGWDGGPNLTQHDVEVARHRLGLDRPLYAQLGDWAEGLVHLDLGRSSHYDAPVAPLASERAENTIVLASVALGLSLVGLPLGVLTGAQPTGWLARVVTPISLGLVSCPPIIGALALLWLAEATQWVSAAPGTLTVPAVALALPLAATLERLQSQATADALRAPDVLAAAARGLSPSRILWRHATRQSLAPVLGVAAVLLGGLFSGSLAVEVVSGWPGLGRLTFEALSNRDLFLGSGCAFVGATLLALSNLVADIARALVDPRAVLT